MKQWIKHKVFTVITRLMGDKNHRITLPVLRGPARGLYFKLDFQTRMETSYFLGSYELRRVWQITKICKNGWTVWDCGGYLGFYTVLFAKLVGSKGCVVVFEPDPRNMLRVKENIMLNRFTNIQFIHAAIGPPIRETDFILSNNTNSHIPGAYIGTTREEYAKVERIDALIRVPCLSLDEAYFNKNLPMPHLIKLDIDGAEEKALQYAYRLAREVKPTIILELHNPDCYRRAWEFSQKTGYVLQSLIDKRIITKPDDVHGALLCLPGK